MINVISSSGIRFVLDFLNFARFPECQQSLSFENNKNNENLEIRKFRHLASGILKMAFSMGSATIEMILLRGFSHQFALFLVSYQKF